MCAVSRIYDMWKPFPDSWYTMEKIELFHSMVEDAKALDKLTGEPDCEDETKAAVAEHIDELEEVLSGYRGTDKD